MLPFHVHQVKGWEIGNFINCTPAVQILHDHLKEPIPVLFDTPHVKEMFLKWDKIQIIEKPHKEEILSSRHDIGFFPGVPEWDYKIEWVLNRFEWELERIPHTYVDPQEKVFSFEDYIVVCRGCLGPYFFLKDPGIEIYAHILGELSKDYKIVFVGSDLDIERINSLNWRIDYKGYSIINNIRRSCGAIQHAKAVVSNDTGMAHVAAAYQKKMLVLWKDTDWKRCRSPSYEGITWSDKGHWEEDFEKWKHHLTANS